MTSRPSSFSSRWVSRTSVFRIRRMFQHVPQRDDVVRMWRGSAARTPCLAGSAGRSFSAPTRTAIDSAHSPPRSNRVSMRCRGRSRRRFRCRAGARACGSRCARSHRGISRTSFRGRGLVRRTAHRIRRRNPPARLQRGGAGSRTAARIACTPRADDSVARRSSC